MDKQSSEAIATLATAHGFMPKATAQTPLAFRPTFASPPLPSSLVRWNGFGGDSSLATRRTDVRELTTSMFQCHVFMQKTDYIAAPTPLVAQCCCMPATGESADRTMT